MEFDEPNRVGPVGVSGAYRPAAVETHSSVVFFAGDRVYKLKKAIDLGFVDLSTVERRRAVCEQETALNRRLSPDVYLGVLDIRDATGEVCDHLVVMRRMPAERRLSTLVEAGEDVTGALVDLAAMLAGFHAHAERSAEADLVAGAEAQSARWTTNTETLRTFAGTVVDAVAVEEVEELAQRYIRGRHRLFASRIEAGRSRDGHGDLLTDDIFLLEDGPRVLDCLEFDESLRLGDVLGDVAFLAMDLERLGRADLGDAFLDAYRNASGDDWPESLAHHHVAYRAQVRAKVAAIRAGQGDPAAAEQARRLLDLTRAHLEAAKVRLVLVGGLPGTGKSTLARNLADPIDAVVLRSDVIRKELAGMAPTERTGDGFGAGIYSPGSTEEVYDELLRRAEVLLGAGHSVILDASWNSAHHRLRARDLATRTAAELTELRCTAPTAVVEARIIARAESGHDASDADVAVARAMGAVADPWPEAATVDTTAEPDAAVGSALAVIAPPGGRDRK